MFSNQPNDKFHLVLLKYIFAWLNHNKENNINSIRLTAVAERGVTIATDGLVYNYIQPGTLRC